MSYTGSCILYSILFIPYMLMFIPHVHIYLYMCEHVLWRGKAYKEKCILKISIPNFPVCYRKTFIWGADCPVQGLRLKITNTMLSTRLQNLFWGLGGLSNDPSSICLHQRHRVGSCGNADGLGPSPKTILQTSQPLAKHQSSPVSWHGTDQWTLQLIDRRQLLTKM